MTPQHNRDLDALAARERLTLLRHWCFSLGLLACVIAITALGGFSIGNPKTWESAYHALAVAGVLQRFVLPLFVLGVVLLVAAFILTVRAAKR